MRACGGQSAVGGGCGGFVTSRARNAHGVRWEFTAGCVHVWKDAGVSCWGVHVTCTCACTAHSPLWRGRLLQGRCFAATSAFASPPPLTVSIVDSVSHSVMCGAASVLAPPSVLDRDVRASTVPPTPHPPVPCGCACSPPPPLARPPPSPCPHHASPAHSRHTRANAGYAGVSYDTSGVSSLESEAERLIRDLRAKRVSAQRLEDDLHTSSGRVARGLSAYAPGGASARSSSDQRRQ
jgi:hypothetical protein